MRRKQAQTTAWAHSATDVLSIFWPTKRSQDSEVLLKLHSIFTALLQLLFKGQNAKALHFCFRFFSRGKLTLLETALPWTWKEGLQGCSWTASGTLVDGLLHSCLGFSTLHSYPHRRHLTDGWVYSAKQRCITVFVFFKWIINDVIRSQTPETSLSLTDAKFNTPIHSEDKNVNNGFIV